MTKQKRKKQRLSSARRREIAVKAAQTRKRNLEEFEELFLQHVLKQRDEAMIQQIKQKCRDIHRATQGWEDHEDYRFLRSVGVQP